MPQEVPRAQFQLSVNVWFLALRRRNLSPVVLIGDQRELLPSVARHQTPESEKNIQEPRRKGAKGQSYDEARSQESYCEFWRVHNGAPHLKYSAAQLFISLHGPTKLLSPSQTGWLDRASERDILYRRDRIPALSSLPRYWLHTGILLVPTL